MTNYTIDAVLFEREHGCWVAQCLQHDIGAQAESLEDLVYELDRSIIGHIAICVSKDVEPFAELGPAPAEYWEKFAKGMVLTAREDAPSFRLPHLAGRPQTRMRVAA